MASKQVAVVTGSNKGIGFAIVRALCKSFKGDVILTARNEDLGKKAVEDLNKEGLKPEFQQLDICDTNSIDRLKSFIQSNYGGLDILVNNAGIAYKQSSTAPFPEQAEVTVKTNFTATLDVCNALFPILRPHARVVHVSSMVSQWSGKKCSDALKARFLDSNLKMDELKQIMADFVQSAKDDQVEEKGFTKSAYGMSKVGVTVMTFIQQRELNSKDDIIVNACCPGYVDTDMSSHKGTKTIDEGAETPVYLALLPHGSDIKGKFLSEKTVQDWPGN
ncbi:hypothetical protein LOTGIDRAFT_191692 [Lottia gigantea]|uniref:carbonyl reductase (NADPH) n=1 Tax=Lottia gigantea TaxID=225164 RepID=V4A6F3_LOTGI|nr:hypothetical protein LOTGIDRAFT_191692 [Lottia gigantea]ESO90595.1 hypothetical protein LOTGIDRAFT_191692 [Lottia gigantea]